MHQMKNSYDQTIKILLFTVITAPIRPIFLIQHTKTFFSGFQRGTVSKTRMVIFKASILVLQLSFVRYLLMLNFVGDMTCLLLMPLLFLSFNKLPATVFIEPRPNLKTKFISKLSQNIFQIIQNQDFRPSFGQKMRF